MKIKAIDFLGRNIEIGDKVVFANPGRGRDLRQGTVKDIKDYKQGPTLLVGEKYNIKRVHMHDAVKVIE